MGYQRFLEFHGVSNFNMGFHDLEFNMGYRARAAFLVWKKWEK
jgi:hypothetical protein